MKAQEPPQIIEVGGKQTIKNLAALQLHNVSEGLELLFGAESCRTTASNQVNAHSSRSHVMYILTIRKSSRTDESSAATESRLYLVDLAGSEKNVSDQASSFVNKSLASLELCISGLA